VQREVQCLLALQSLQTDCSNLDVSTLVRPLVGQPPVQSFRLLRYRRYRFGDPTMPLGLPSAVWFSLSRLRGSTVKQYHDIHSSSLASLGVLPSRA